MGLLPELTKRVKIAIGISVAVSVLAVVVILVVVTGKKIDYGDYDHEPWAQVRLPSNIRAESYKMALDIDFNTWDYTGTQEVTMSVTGKAKYFLIHASGLVIDDDLTTLETSAGDQLAVTLQSLTGEAAKLAAKNDFYVVSCDAPVTAGSYVLKLSFSAKVQTDRLTGLYRSSYDRAATPVYQVATDFEPVDARTAFPCFDEPAQKAKWTTTIKATLPASATTTDYKIISNMELDGDITHDTNTVSATFKESVAMSTYLVCFCVSDFVGVTDVYTRTDGSKVTMTVWARREAEFQATTGYALQVTAAVLKKYEEFYNVKYPLNKLDQLALPSFNSGAMENWGIILYRESSLLYNPSTSSAAEKQRVCAVIAHELAHQWFGNAVTMAWWNDLWLNEGFASFVEYYGIDAAEPTWKIMDSFYKDEVVVAMNLDSSPMSHPISVEVNSPDDISAIFDTISYRKGSSINWMMLKFMGDKAFQSGIQSYLKTYEWGNAEMVQLFDIMTDAAGDAGLDMNVTEIMLTWTKQMGYPVVTVSKGEGGHLQINQTRFMTGPAAEDDVSPYNYAWHVPFSYITNLNSDPVNIWMKPSDKSVTLDGTSTVTWLKGNAGANSYYRVNYPPAMWAEITKALNTGLITEAPDRTSLLKDVFALASVGLADYHTALDMTTFGENEGSYPVMSTVLGAVNGLGAKLNTTAPEYKKYQDYVHKLVTPLVTSLTWDINPTTDTFTTPYLRNMVLKSYCLKTDVNSTDLNVVKANELFKTFNDTGVINKDLMTTILGVAMTYDDDANTNANILWRKYKASEWEADKRLYIRAMSMSKNTTFLQQLLLDSMSEPQGIAWRFVYYVAVEGEQYDMAWQHIQTNWDKYTTWYNKASFTMGYVVDIPSVYSTQDKYDEVKAFYELKKDTLGTGARKAEEALAKIQQKIDWKSKYLNSVVSWFNAL